MIDIDAGTERGKQWPQEIALRKISFEQPTYYASLRLEGGRCKEQRPKVDGIEVDQMAVVEGWLYISFVMIIPDILSWSHLPWLYISLSRLYLQCVMFMPLRFPYYTCHLSYTHLSCLYLWLVMILPLVCHDSSSHLSWFYLLFVTIKPLICNDYITVITNWRIVCSQNYVIINLHLKKTRCIIRAVLAQWKCEM